MITCLLSIQFLCSLWVGLPLFKSYAVCTLLIFALFYFTSKTELFFLPARTVSSENLIFSSWNEINIVSSFVVVSVFHELAFVHFLRSWLRHLFSSVFVCVIHSALFKGGSMWTKSHKRCQSYPFLRANLELSSLCQFWLRSRSLCSIFELKRERNLSFSALHSHWYASNGWVITQPYSW